MKIPLEFTSELKKVLREAREKETARTKYTLLQSHMKMQNEKGRGRGPVSGLQALAFGGVPRSNRGGPREPGQASVRTHRRPSPTVGARRVNPRPPIGRSPAPKKDSETEPPSADGPAPSSATPAPPRAKHGPPLSPPRPPLLGQR